MQVFSLTLESSQILKAPINRQVERSGFTIVEILVVIGIIGVLVSLILPAVMSARGAARRLECESRIRQFGLALHNFESNHGHLPYGTIFRDLESGGTDWISTQVQLLPHLEQSAAFQKLTSGPRLGLTGPEMTLRIPVFHCPDEPVAVGVSYRTCSGAHAGYYDYPYDQHRGTLSTGFGALPGSCSLKPIRMADIQDGLSQTAAMSERTISPGPGSAFDRHHDVWFSAVSTLGFDVDQRTTDEAVNVCKSLTGTPTSSYSPFAGRNVIEDGFVYTAYNHALPPNSSIPHCTMGVLALPPAHAWLTTGTAAVVGARSNHHDRTVCVLLMDGSVRVVTPEVDLAAWRALASRQDGDRALE